MEIALITVGAGAAFLAFAAAAAYSMHIVCPNFEKLLTRLLYVAYILRRHAHVIS